MFNHLAFAIWTVEALLQLAAPSDPQIRPDGKAFAFVYKGEIHTGALPSGSDVRVLTKGNRPRWSPDGRKLAYLNRQVFVRDLASGTERQLTWAASGVSSFEWSPKGDAVAYIARDPGPEPDPIVADTGYRYSRIYWQALSGTEARRLTKADRHVISLSISPDGRQIAYAAQPTPRNTDAFNVDIIRIDLHSGEEHVVVTQPGRDGEPSWSPDGRSIAFHSQAGSNNYFEARHVAVVPATGGSVQYITQGKSYDVFRGGTNVHWSAGSDVLTFTAGRGVHDVLVQESLTTGETSVLTEGVAGAASFTSDSRRAVYSKASPSRPPELFLWDNGTERQLTHLQDSVAANGVMRSEVVRWKSSDGLQIEGLLWLPPDYTAGKRIPILTELHGGPTGVTLHSFPIPRVYPIQLFVQSGIGVFSPNYRGSVNYGPAFRLKNAQSQGFGDFQDVMTGIDHLVASGIADADRLGLMGWSYGGYLAASVISQTNRFKAASIGAPATDWLTYYGQSDASPEILRTYFGGSPWDVPENYNRHSLRSRLKNIKTPSLLQVGAVDINHNGDIYKALVDHGVPVEYVVYPREGHGIAEPAHVRDVMQRNLAWFLRWLNVTPANASGPQ